MAVQAGDPDGMASAAVEHRLVLLGIASKYIHQNLAPWCLKAGLQAYGVCIPCQVVEVNINQPLFKSLEAIARHRPTILGISCYIWNMEYAASLMACLRQLFPDVVMVGGGPEVGFRPADAISRFPQLDYVITGPGEYAFAMLCKALQEGRCPNDIPGLTFRQGEGVCSTPPQPLPGPPPSPYGEDVGGIEGLCGRIAYIETSRGCPFACAFCLSGRDDPVTFLPMEEVHKQLRALVGAGVQTVKFVDRTFNCNKARAMEILRFLLNLQAGGEGAGVCFHFEVAADLFDDEMLALLTTAPPGLFQMEAGIQSFHAPALEACNRKTDLEKACRNIRTLLGPGNIHLHVDLIAGLPYEDIGAFAQSFEAAFALRPHMLQLGFLKLLHGSELRRRREEYGYHATENPPYEVFESKWMSYGDMTLLKACEDALERLYNHGRFHETIAYVCRAAGISAFQFFCDMGTLLAKEPGGVSKARCAALVLEGGGRYNRIDAMALRDCLVRDWLRSDNTGRLPPCLKVQDPRLSPAVSALRRHYGRDNGLGVAILYHGSDRLFVAEYERQNPVTGEYPAREWPLEE